MISALNSKADPKGNREARLSLPKPECTDSALNSKTDTKGNREARLRRPKPEFGDSALFFKRGPKRSKAQEAQARMH